ncbi:hypothetical protein [Lunatimonas sp.]|nr:hypothetical protein [Lunatimonas sp.]
MMRQRYKVLVKYRIWHVKRDRREKPVIDWSILGAWQYAIEQV